MGNVRQKFALIVAGGHGLRMGEGIPKQFLPLKGRPVLFHTIEKFSGIADHITLVLPAAHMEYWENLCLQYNFSTPLSIVSGGVTRSQSVKNGLFSLTGDGVVAIHDAVRPLLTKDLIIRVFLEAMQKGNAIPAIPAKDSMRMIDGKSNKAVKREDYVLVQTPQCFELNAIRQAYHECSEREFTDDAGLFEYSGNVINLVEGETANIKITYKEDLLFAQSCLDSREGDDV